MELKSHQNTKTIPIGSIKIGGDNPFVLIAGPCVIESEDMALSTAQKLLEITQKARVPFIYKSSYDKANRTSIKSFRGPGLKQGLLILERIKKEFNVPILSDVHSEHEIEEVSPFLDIIQIPAFLCRQTDLLVKAAQTKKPVNIKKGQFLSPWDMEHTIKKIESEKNHNILLTERGASFGYNNLVSDFRSLPIMRSFGYPVVYDATHSVQLPGGMHGASGGQREFLPYLAKAAIAVGVDAVFMEAHPDPSNALSDGPNMIALENLYELLIKLKEIDAVIRKKRKP